MQVRHAQGIHNVAGEKDYDAYLSEELFDAHLTPLGWQQVCNGESLVKLLVFSIKGLKKNLAIGFIWNLLKILNLCFFWNFMHQSWF